MEWDQIEAIWPRFKSIIKHDWKQLSDLQIKMIAGKPNQLIEKINLL